MAFTEKQNEKRGDGGMKKKLIISGLCGLALLLMGAVAVDQLIVEPKIISSWSDLNSAYNSRPGLPPLPDFEPLTIYKMILAENWSFTTNRNWYQIESGGTFYVSKDSKELRNLKLPLTIRIYDYLPTDSVYILSSRDGTNFTSETAFVSEPLTEPGFEEMTSAEQGHDLLFNLWKKRTVWEINLKSEDSILSDLLNVRQTSLAATDAPAGMPAPQMLLSVPEEHTNDLWLCIEGSGEDQTLNVFSPESLSNIDVFATGDLGSGLWTRIATNLNPVGPTNPAVVTIGDSVAQHYRARTWGDEDEDGLSDGEELYVYKTSPTNPDSDGDGLNDGAEVQTYGTNPASNDTDNDGMPDGWEIAHGLNPLADDGLEDPDGDLFSNLHEYLIDTDPHSNMSAVESIIFDEDTSTLEDFDYVTVITNASLAHHGETLLEFSVTNKWHYYPQLDFEAVSFGNSDTLEFYIRTTSGVCTNVLRVWVYYSSPSEMSYPLDILPYLYDSNSVPSPGSITEVYKKVSIPVDVLRQGGSNTVGTIRHMRLGILYAEATNNYPFPQTFYVDCISLQDKSGAVAENLEVLSANYLEITSDNQLDEISLRNPANHTVIRQSDGSPIAVTDIGLRSWITDFNGSQSSPVVKHYIYVKLADALADGEAYIYSNSVQDISGNYPSDSAVTFTLTNTVPTSSIKVNQVGWLPEATKIAYVGNYLGDMGAMPLDTNVSHTATIRNADTGEAVYSTQLVKAVESDLIDIAGTNGPAFLIPFSGEETWRLDFTPLQTLGTYYVDIPSVGASYRFQIGSNIYADAYYHCMRSLWYQRSGISMTNPAYSGIWTRQGDLQQNTNTAFYHNSIYDKSPLLYAGEEIGGFADFTGGWYDAADYDKYTKSAADSVNLLLTMYEIKPERFADNQLNLPESGNGIPDVLDEAKWELDWIAKMVSSNGATFNKCTYETWPSGMPSEQTKKMWVTFKTTRDTAAACGILAKAARIYAPYDAFSAELYSNKATLAWQCLTNFPDSYPIPPTSNWDDYNNPPGTNWVVNGVTNVIPGIHTGNYFSTNDVTYRLWAATEMYRLTEDSAVHDEFSNIVYRAKGEATATNFLKSVVGDGSWMGNANSMILMVDYITLTNGLPVYEEWQSAMRGQFISTVSNYWKTCDMDLPYDFEIKSHSILQWGEGSQIRRPYGYILAYELTGNDWFLGEALKNIDWPLGANPLNTTYITGLGSKYPMKPHNKIDHGDGIDEPIPGFNIYGLAWELDYNNYYQPIIDYSYPPYQYSPTNSIQYPLARKYVDVWESVKHGEFVVDDLARTAMVFAYFSSTNAP
jgi:endoglucanase